jgi:hypothetical protein
MLLHRISSFAAMVEVMTTIVIKLLFLFVSVADTIIFEGGKVKHVS